MSPEQLRSAKLSDHRTDIWALGSVLYCALAGRAPHAEMKSFVSLITAICSQAPPPLRQLAPWVAPEAAGVVERAMEIDPERRFPSARAMLDALGPLLPTGFVLREEMITPHGPSRSGRAPFAHEDGLSTTSLDAGHYLRQPPG
jgi:serine/threonine-protein kinase